MPTSQPLDILLAHDQWATSQLLSACEKLTPEQFHQRFELGPGSLHDTITHMLAALRGWGDMIAQRPQRERLDESGTQYTVPQLTSLHEEISRDFAHTAQQHPVDQLVTGSRGGREFTFTRGAVVTHVTTHGTHHRAQALNMLRHLGVEPLPPSSVLEWMMMVDGQGKG